MAAFLTDNFTAADAVLLENHTADSGATWAKNGAATGGSLDVRANRIRAAVIPADYVASVAPSSADYEVTGTFRVLTVNVVGALFAIAARYSTSVRSGYQVQLNARNSGAHLWQLVRIDAGTQTTLASVAATFVAATTYTATLRVLGSKISVIVGGVEILAATDSTYTTAGRVGVAQGQAAGTTAGVHLDALTANYVLSAIATVAGDGTISGAATRKAVVSASVAGAGAFNGTGGVTRIGSAAISGAGAVAASGTRQTLGAAAVDAVVVISGSAIVTPPPIPETSTAGRLALGAGGAVPARSGAVAAPRQVGAVAGVGYADGVSGSIESTR